MVELEYSYTWVNEEHMNMMNTREFKNHILSIAVPLWPQYIVDELRDGELTIEFGIDMVKSGLFTVEDLLYFHESTWELDICLSNSINNTDAHVFIQCSVPFTKDLFNGG